MSELDSARQKIVDEAHDWSDQDRVHIEVDLTKSEYAAVMVALRSSLAESEWQSIETAPKDKCIWVFDINRYYEGKVRWNGHEWECLDWKGYGTGVGFYPTHWLPLPDLPNKLPRDHGPR